MPAAPVSLVQLPALRFLLPLLAGILVQWYLPLPLWIPAGVFLFTWLIFLIWLSGPRSRRLKARTAQSVLGYLSLAAIGAVLVYTRHPLHQPLYRPDLIAQPHLSLHLTLLEPLNEKPGSYKAEARIEAARDRQGRLYPLQARVLIYFRKADGKPALGYGSRILLHRPPELIRNAGNPGGFDYQQYALMHGFTHQAFAGEKDYTALPGFGGDFFHQALFCLRQQLLEHIDRHIGGTAESAVAQALLIGYRTRLDDDLVQAYSNTGVVHIIAISGMHLAMLYVLLRWLLGLTGHRRWQRMAYPLLIILFIWGFSLLSGAAPSIVRSAVMFTFLLAGELLGRPAKQYNLLAMSALLLLIYNPFYFWDVGFQLSYAAVLSILLFQRKIEGGLYYENRVLRYIWSLCSVSLAAQTLTLPLIMYHFHQFPLLFLATNLMAVPVSGLALYALLGLVTLGWIPGLGWLFGWMSEALISWLNQFILSINAIPGGVVNGIQYSLIQATLLTLCFLLASAWWLRRSPRAGWASLVLLLGFAGLHTLDYIRRSRQRLLIIYNVPKATAIDVVAGFQYRFVGNEELRQDGFVRNFHLKPSRVLHRTAPLTDSTGIHTWPEGFTAFGKRIRMVYKPLKTGYGAAPDTADMVLICQNPRLRLEQLVRQIHSPVYIADGSNNRISLQHWQHVADSLHLPLFVTTARGAYIHSF